MEIKKAVRRALPLQIAFVGPTNSGKTLSALLFAAGLAPNAKVCVIDTEHGRASLYADNKRILAAMPQGFDVIELDAPYTPKRFVEAIELAEKSGYKICLIDSASDSWDGQGGCSDMAEAANNMWNKAKLENKRLMNRIALSDMHIICCLKAHEKTKIVDKAKSTTGKQEYIDLGMQPICEKNFFYPMTLAFMVDAKTHESSVIKMHDDIADKFTKPRLITAQDGAIVAQWNNGAKALADNEQLFKRSKDAAHEGESAYRLFFEGITKEQRTSLKSVHEENKKIAKAASSVPVFGSKENPVEWPDSFDGEECVWNGEHLRRNESGNYGEVVQND
jgi:hypothetical protein